ncbi:hypothetical protein ACTJ2M_000295 [Vibrio parahaemolyticus]
MKLKVIEIKNSGTLNQEYVKLKVVNDCNLKYYLLADTTYISETSISNKLRHMYWFAPKDVKKDDVIYVYSGKGKNTSNSGVHKYYWNLSKSVWNDDDDAALLFEVNDWKTTRT